MPLTIKFANRQVHDILADIRASYSTVREMGDDFERLFCEVAKREPELEVKDIWQWSDWVKRQDHLADATDYGIDLVAELNGGQLVAIQCKCYAKQHKVSKDDVKDFLSAINPDDFSLFWFVATSGYTKNAATLLLNKKVRIIDFGEYCHLKIDSGKKPPPRKPWKLQSKAIEQVLRGFAKPGSDRGRLIMACGTGKTFTSLRIAEQIAPSIERTHATPPPPPPPRFYL